MSGENMDGSSRGNFTGGYYKSFSPGMPTSTWPETLQGFPVKTPAGPRAYNKLFSAAVSLVGSLNKSLARNLGLPYYLTPHAVGSLTTDFTTTSSANATHTTNFANGALTPGNTLVAFAASHSAGGANSITAPAGWLRVDSSGDGTITDWVLFVLPASTNTTPSSVLFSGAQATCNWTIAVAEVYGLDPVNPVDKHTVTSQTTATTKTTGSVTPTQAGDFLFVFGFNLAGNGMALTNSQSVPTPNNNFNNTGSIQGALGYGLYTGTAAITGTETSASSVNASAGILLLNPAFITVPDVNFTGSLQKSVTKSFSGTETFSASLKKFVTKTFADAASTFTGLLTALKTGGGIAYTQTFTAAVNFAGDLRRAVSKPLTASESYSGTVTKSVTKSQSASESFTGSLKKSDSKSLSAASIFAGMLKKGSSKPLTGSSVTLAGNLTKADAKGLTASESFVGSLKKANSKNLGATESFTGSIRKDGSKSLGASETFVGSLKKAISKPLTAAAATFTGALTTFKSAAGVAYNVSLSAVVALTGSLRRAVGKSHSASTSSSGTLKKSTTKSFTSSEVYTAALRKSVTKAHPSATITMSGLFSKGTTKIAAGSIILSASFRKSTNKTISASESFTTTLRKDTAKPLQSTITSTGLLKKAIEKSLLAVRTFTGVFTHLNKTPFIIAVKTIASRFVGMFATAKRTTTVQTIANRSITTRSVISP